MVLTELDPAMLEYVERARVLLSGTTILTPAVLKQLHAIQLEAGVLLHGKITGSQEVVPLPTYDSPTFNQILQRKKEFREHASGHVHESLDSGWKASCNSEGDFSLTDLQLLLKNFLSPGTPYNSVLLNHGVGVGKTCSAVTIAENFPEKKVLVLTSPGLQHAFKRQVFDVAKIRVREDGTLDLQARTQCTGTTYIDKIPNAHLLGAAELDRRISALISKRYTFMGMDRFANIVSDLGEDVASIEKIRSKFSNFVILVDEAHHLRSVQGVEAKRVTAVLSRVLQYTERVKLVLMTATPMYNDARDVIDLINLMLVNDKRRPLRNAEVFDVHGAITEAGKLILHQAARGYVSFMPGGSPYSFPRRLHDVAATPSGQLPTVDIFGKGIAGHDRISKLQLTCTAISKVQSAAYNEAALGFARSDVKPTKKDQDQVDLEGDADADGDGDGDGDEQADLDQDTEGDDSKRHGKALRVGQQLLNLVYPMQTNLKNKKSWAIGQIGFSQCFEKDARGAGKSGTLRVSYREGVPHFLASPLLADYSPKMDTVVKSVISCKGVALCYSRFVWSGAVPLAIALEHQGFSRHGAQNILKTPNVSATGKGHGMSYTIITGSIDVGGDSDADVASARAAANVDGAEIKVIIVTSKASEGVDLRFVRQIHILEPWYNLQKLTQIFGRASRHCSHALLPASRRNFTLFLHAIRDNNSSNETLDLRAYRVSESKQRRIDDVQRVLHSSAFDCAMNRGKIEDDRKLRTADAQVEDCYGVKRTVSGKITDGFEDVFGECDASLHGDMDESTYDLERHAYSLDVYERAIRAALREKLDVSYDVLKTSMGKGARDDFMAMVLTRMIDRREPVTDSQGRVCTIKHLGKYYVADPLDDGSLDPTVKPRRQLVVGLAAKVTSTSKSRPGSGSGSGSGSTSRTRLPMSSVLSMSIVVGERVEGMAADLGLQPSANAKILIKKLEGVIQDAVIDRLSPTELRRLVFQTPNKVNTGKSKKPLNKADKAVYDTLLSGGLVVLSTSDDGYYLRDHSGRWFCLQLETKSTENCDSVARVDPAVVECMATNRALRSVALAALVRNARGGHEFRLLSRGMSKQGSICMQTSTYTLDQLRAMCIAALHVVDSGIPVDPLNDMQKKRLCLMYELAMRLRNGVFARPSQMLDA